MTGHKVLKTLGRELTVMNKEERERALMSHRVEEKTSGDSRRPRWSLGLQQLHLKYYNGEGLKAPLEPETEYRYPRIESYYRTRDTWLTDA